MEEAWGDAGLSVAQGLERAAERFYDGMRSPKARDGEPTVSGFDHLSVHKYALLVSRKRSGDGVPTPMWFGLDDVGRAYVRTGKLAAKVKRIRRDPRVKLAPCTLRGVPRGPFAEGRARICEPSEEEHAEAVIQSNYGTGRQLYERTAASYEAFYIEVTPA